MPNVSKSLFNLISIIISGGAFSKSVVCFASKVALFELCLYISNLDGDETLTSALEYVFD